MAMDPQEKRTWIKVGFIFVFFLAAILAMPKMGFYSRVNEYKETEKKREKVSKAFDDSKTKVKELPGLEKKIAQMESDIAYFERRLPNDPDAPELFDLLKRLGLESGIRFVNLKGQPPIMKDVAEISYTEIPMDLEFVGDYHSMGAFISKIEGSDRFAKIDSLDIRPNVQEDAGFVYGLDPFYRQRCKLKLSTFMLQASKADAPDESKE
jgi:type IV pilus assembly protein PilO